MRCPNCSFLNPDDAEECKICGHELKAKVKANDDDNISQTLNAIFGQADDSKKAASDPSNKKVDPRFEEYLEMNTEDDTSDADLEADQWLEALQRDIQTADEEIKALRSSQHQKKASANTPADETPQEPPIQNEVPYAAMSQSIGQADNLSNGAGLDSPLTDNLIPTDEDNEESAPVTASSESDSSQEVTPEKASSHEVNSQEASSQKDMSKKDTTEKATPQKVNMPYEALSEDVSSPDNLSSTPLHNPVGLDPITEEVIDSPQGPQEDYFEVDEEAVNEDTMDDLEESININLTQHDVNTHNAPSYEGGNRDYADTLIDEEDYDDDNRSNRSRQHIIILVALLAVIIIFLFIKSLGQTPSDSQDPSLADPEDSGQVVDVTPNTDGLSEVYNFIDTFYANLSDYVNTGSIGVTSMFTNAQDALSQLSDYKAAGDIVSYDYEPFDDLDVSNDPLNLTVTANITRMVNDVETPIKSNWTFVLDHSSGDYLISSLKIEPLNDSNDFSDNNSGNNDVSDANTGSNSSQDSASNSDSNTSTPDEIKPEGFINSGSFSGGVIADGQDVANIRYGRHEAFERMVFDLYKWTGYDSGAAPTETVEEACHFDATLSDDGKTITLIFSGARAASASIPNLTGSNSIENINIYYPSDDSSVGVTITLKSPSAYKAFALKSPGKVVVDVMPRQ